MGRGQIYLTVQSQPTLRMPQLGAQCLNEVDLDGLQKALIRGAGGAPVRQQIEVPISRLDKGQPHQCAAFDAGHFDAGLKTRAGRRRPGYLQHRILMSQKGNANAAPDSDHGVASTMSDS
jgi:hypothetical protein